MRTLLHYRIGCSLAASFNTFSIRFIDNGGVNRMSFNTLIGSAFYGANKNPLYITKWKGKEGIAYYSQYPMKVDSPVIKGCFQVKTYF